MNIIKHRFNQIKFYIGRYGFIRTIKKCIKTVLNKIKRIINGKKYEFKPKNRKILILII